MSLLFVGWCLLPGGGTLSERLLAFDPPDVPADQKDRKMTGVHSEWIIAHFNTYSEGSEDAVVQRYVRSCVWHMHDEWQFANLLT
jgi:hypothetical protein